MKRILLLLSVLFLLVIPRADAGLEGRVTTVIDAVVVGNTDVSTSTVIGLNKGEYIGIWYQATSTSSASDVKIEFQMSYNQTDANFAVPDGASDITSSVTDELPHIARVSAPPMQFLRIIVTGNASNPGDSIVTVILFHQEQGRN